MNSEFVTQRKGVPYPVWIAFPGKHQSLGKANFQELSLFVCLRIRFGSSGLKVSELLLGGDSQNPQAFPFIVNTTYTNVRRLSLFRVPRSGMKDSKTKTKTKAAATFKFRTFS